MRILKLDLGYRVCVRRFLSGPNSGGVMISYVSPAEYRKYGGSNICCEQCLQTFWCSQDDIDVALGFLEHVASVKLVFSWDVHQLDRLNGDYRHVHYTLAKSRRKFRA